MANFSERERERGGGGGGGYSGAIDIPGTELFGKFTYTAARKLPLHSDIVSVYIAYNKR